MKTAAASMRCCQAVPVEKKLRTGADLFGRLKKMLTFVVPK
jgi:hypothetical protein